MTFHRLIVEASGNRVLLRVWDSLMLEVRTRIGLAQLDIDLTMAAETHVPIVDAFDRGDGETAGRLLREHAEMFCHGEPNERSRPPGDQPPAGPRLGRLAGRRTIGQRAPPGLKVARCPGNHGTLLASAARAG